MCFQRSSDKMRRLAKYWIQFCYQNMQRKEREGKWMKTPQLRLFIQVKVFTVIFCIFWIILPWRPRAYLDILRYPYRAHKDPNQHTHLSAHNHLQPGHRAGWTWMCQWVTCKNNPGKRHRPFPSQVSAFTIHLCSQAHSCEQKISGPRSIACPPAQWPSFKCGRAKGSLHSLRIPSLHSYITLLGSRRWIV